MAHTVDPVALPVGGTAPARSRSWIALVLGAVTAAACTASPTTTGGTTGQIGNLSFVPAGEHVTAPSSGVITLADIDGNGTSDIVTQHLLEQRVDVRLNAGDGRFPVDGVRSTVLPYEPGSVALADLDGDRHHDLVISSRGPDREYVHVRTGDGTGGFAAAPTPPYATRASAPGYKPAVEIADVDGDQDLDIIVGNGRRPALDILLGDGAGSFSAGRGIDLPPDLELYAFGLGNVDGDEHVDLVVTGTGPQTAPGPVTGGRIVMLPGAGGGTFGGPHEIRAPVAGGPRLLSTSDLDGDGLADLLLGHERRGLLTVLHNRNGQFLPAVGSPFELPDESYEVAVADLDLDGFVDLAVPTDRALVVLLSARTTFVPAAGSPYPVGPGAYRVATGTVDDDRLPDLVASSFDGPSATLLLGTRA